MPLLPAGNEPSMAQREASLTLFRVSHLLGVMLPGQDHGGAPSASKGTWTVGRRPGKEAGFEVSQENCAYGELEGHLRVDCARWVLSDT